MQTLHLFPVIDQLLIKLLDSLNDEDWNKKTLAKKWTVKDVAAHLLDVTMRDISIYRDDYLLQPHNDLSSYKKLVDHLNELNAVWVSAFKRVSPLQIIEMLKSTTELQYKELCKLDPLKPAIFSVAWAGESRSTNEFHIAREYTEKFHHQLQIREAVGKSEEIITPELFTPFIHTLLMGLPHVYRQVEAPKGTEINIRIKPFGLWKLVKEDHGWILLEGISGRSEATIDMDADTAWKLFTKGISPEEALQQVSIEGDKSLGATALTMVSVMA